MRRSGPHTCHGTSHVATRRGGIDEATGRTAMLHSYWNSVINSVKSPRLQYMI